MLGAAAICLTLLRAVDTAEADTLGVIVMQKSIVSPSRMETTGPVKSAPALEENESHRRSSAPSFWRLILLYRLQAQLVQPAVERIAA